jgi:hypothetical protein
MQVDWKIFVPWVLTVATAGIGIWQYADKQAQTNREPFLREQLKLVFEASEAVSKLATLTDAAEWEKARTDFWVLYWGPLGIVEDPAVAKCMIKAGALVPRPGQPVPPLPLASLEPHSIRLSHAARDLVLDSWNVSLPPLQPERLDDGKAPARCE